MWSQLTKNGSNFHVLFIWLELLFSNMFSVIIWKQNFEKRNITGAIASFPPIRPFTIPSTITMSALTSKLLRNSTFSQRYRVFFVFFYQIDTSNDFLRRYFRFLRISFSMAKIEKYLWTKCYCFFHFTYTYQISRKLAWKYRFAHRPPNPRSKLETLPKMEKAVTQKWNHRFFWNLYCIFL